MRPADSGVQTVFNVYTAPFNVTGRHHRTGNRMRFFLIYYYFFFSNRQRMVHATFLSTRVCYLQTSIPVLREICCSCFYKHDEIT